MPKVAPFPLACTPSARLHLGEVAGGGTGRAQALTFEPFTGTIRRPSQRQRTWFPDRCTPPIQ